jgi:hypothetical protein
MEGMRETNLTDSWQIRNLKTNSLLCEINESWMDTKLRTKYSKKEVFEDRQFHQPAADERIRGSKMHLITLQCLKYVTVRAVMTVF